MHKKRPSRSESKLTDEGIFIFLTLVIFFGAVGFPTLINTTPTFGYDENTIQRLTPVTSYYQQAFAEQEMMETLAFYNYNPLLYSAWLAMPDMLENPPDFMTLLADSYGKNINIETGFIEIETFQELFSPQNNLLDSNNFEILPKAYAGAPPPCSVDCDLTNSTTWNLREHDVNVGGSPTVDVTTNSSDNSLVITHTGTIGSFLTFKAFDASELDGQTIAITWKNFEGGTDFTPSITINDGEYDRTDASDFPEDANIASKGAGVLTTCLGEPTTPFSLNTYECLISTTGSTEGNATVFIRYDTSVGINELDIHQINITGLGIWDYTDSHTIDYTATGSDNDNGEVSSAFTARTFPDPEYYYDFDDVNCGANICTNLGTAGVIGNANHTTDDGATVENIRFSDTSVLGEAIVINGTDSGATQTEMRLGSFADRSQFDFLLDDNESNKTSINFWIDADIDGASPSYVVLSMGTDIGGTPSSGIDFIWVGGFGVGGDVQNLIEENGFIMTNPDNNLGVPDDNEWHMVTITLDKQQATGGMKICVDGSSNCILDDLNGVWNNTYTATSNTELVIGEVDCHGGIGGGSCNNTELKMDELAIWQDYELTNTEIDFLFNNGTANRVVEAVTPVNVCDSSIGSEFRVACYDFESENIDDSRVNNLGTFGSQADAIYYVSDVETTVVTDTQGKFGDAIFQDGTGTGGTYSDIRLGEFADRSQWDFLHTLDGSNITSINFWINGDIDGNPEYPVIDTYNSTEGAIDSFRLFTRAPEWEMDVFESSSIVNNVDFTSATAFPPDDGQWDMITLLYDKGNATTGADTTAIIYLNADFSSPATTDFGSIFAGGGGIAQTPLKIGGKDGSSVTENAFSIDDFAVWHGYQLTNADILQLFNGTLVQQTVGSVCDSSIGEDFRVGCYTFDSDNFLGTPSIYQNLGSTSFNGTARYFESGVLADFESNSTGVINQAVFQNGTGTGGVTAVIQLGDFADDWNFLHTANVGENITSINFWYNGDIIGSPVYPIFNTGNSDNSGVGFSIYTISNQLRTHLRDGDSQGTNLSFGSTPTDDGNWHMLTVIMDKGNSTGNWMITCTDGTCGNSGGLNQPISTTVTSPFANLTLGAGTGFGFTVTENGYNYDDVTIWQGYQLTESDVSAMYNSGAGATGRDIEPSSQVLHQSFDDADFVAIPNVADNLGTLGSVADATYFENGNQTTFNVNATGKIEQAVTQEGTGSLDDQGEIILETITSTFDFIHRFNVGENETSINFWINGDVDGSPEYPLLTSYRPNLGEQNGFIFYTLGADMCLTLEQDDAHTFFQDCESASGIPADDGDWHMVTLLMDKGTTTATVCVDGSANCGTINGDNPFSATDSTSDRLLKIGSQDFLSSFTENTFNVDDFAIWNGYTLTNADIDNLFNLQVNQSEPAPPAGTTTNQTESDAVIVVDSVSTEVTATPTPPVTLSGGEVVIQGHLFNNFNLYQANANWATTTGGGIFQTTTLADQQITKIRVKTLWNDTPQLTVTGQIISGCGDNTSFETCTIEAISDIFNTTDHGSASGGDIIQLNFTGAPFLTGEYLVGIRVDGDTTGNEFEVYTNDDSKFPFAISGECITIEFFLPAGDVEACTDFDATADDLGIKVFANDKTVTEEVLFNTLNENQPTSFTGDVGGNTYRTEIENGGAGHFAEFDGMIGQLVTLDEDIITAVRINPFDCGQTDNGDLTALVLEKPTEGSATIPTILQTSDTFNIVNNHNATGCSSNFPEDLLDITFNFTNPSALTGEHLIAINVTSDDEIWFPAWDNGTTDASPSGSLKNDLGFHEGEMWFLQTFGTWERANSGAITDADGNSFSDVLMAVNRTTKGLPTGEEVIYNGLRADQEKLLANFGIPVTGGYMLSNMTAVDNTVTKMRLKIAGSIDATAGNITGVVMTGCIEGGELGDCTIQGESDVWDIADHDGSLGIQILQFNFTDMPELSGEIFVGAKIIADDEFSIFTNNASEYPFPTSNVNHCFVVDNLDANADFDGCVRIPHPQSDTLAIKVFATQQGLEDTLLFDTMHENQLNHFSGGGGGDTCSQSGEITGNGEKCGATYLSEPVTGGAISYYGQLVTLDDDKVTRVLIDGFDCGQTGGGFTDGNLTAVVMSQPTVDTSTIPTIHQTSNRLDYEEEICTGVNQFDIEQIVDLEFEFASPVELTGDYLIAIRQIGSTNEIGFPAWDTNQTNPLSGGNDLAYHDGEFWNINDDTVGSTWKRADSTAFQTIGGLPDSKLDHSSDILMAVFVESEFAIVPVNTETSIFNTMYGDEFVNIIASKGGSTGIIGQNVTLNGESITKVRFKLGGEVEATTGTLQGIILKPNATGTFECQILNGDINSCILVGRSTNIINATDLTSSEEVIEFEFEGIPPLDVDDCIDYGTDRGLSCILVGMEWENVDDTIDLMGSNSTFFPFDGDHPESHCFTVEGKYEPLPASQDLDRCFDNSFATDSIDDIAMKIFGNKSGIETTLFDTLNENQEATAGQLLLGNTFFAEWAGVNPPYIGQLVTLDEDAITNVRMNFIDCADGDATMDYQAVVMEEPTAGSATVPTIIQTSDILSDPPECGATFPNSVIDVTFNFTNPVSLTGDYLIAVSPDNSSSEMTFPVWHNDTTSGVPDLQHTVGEMWTLGRDNFNNWARANDGAICDDNLECATDVLMEVTISPPNLFSGEAPAGQTFDQTIIDTVNPTDGTGQDGANIALSNLLVYHRFDTQDLINGGLKSENLGTLGSDADAEYFIPVTNLTATAIVTNTTGLIGQSIFQDGDVDGVDRAEVRMGVDADKSQYDFLHRANTLDNLTSINFWINGDTDGGADYPILDTIEYVEAGASGGDGMTIFTANGQLTFDIYNDGSPETQSSHSSQPADDGQWHMVTAIYDKGNLTGVLNDYLILCIDGSTGCETFNDASILNVPANTANSTLTLGSRHDPFGNIVENKFNIDDLAIWNGYQLSLTEIDELYNSGNGKPVIGDTLVSTNVTSVPVVVTVESVCDSSVGEDFRKACYTFDIADCSGNECTNFGTLGTFANANHTTDDRATTEPMRFNGTGVIGEAVFTNGTDSGATQTEIRLGDFADRSQWDFLWDDNDENVTSVNFWLQGDIDGATPTYGVLSQGSVAGSGNHIWIGGFSAGGDVNSVITENSINRQGFDGGTVGVPDDGQFHMVTVITDKNNSTSTTLVCVDGSSNCSTINRSSAWDNSFTGTSLTELVIGEIDCDGTCNNTELLMDDLAIWDGYQLTTEDIDNLFNMTLPASTEELSICEADIGQSELVACYTFDSTDCTDNICTNFGTFGTTANANHTTSNRATIADVWLNNTAVIGGAIRVNGTDFGTPQTEVHLGDFADRSQWDFLWDDNDGNVTSINFWLMQDLEGGGGDPFYGTMGMAREEFGNDEWFWLGGRGISSGDGDLNTIIGEDGTELIESTFNTVLGVPDDGQFHMITVITDKNNATSTSKYCVDGSTNCTTVDRNTTWDNLFTGTSVQDLTIGEIDCQNGGGSGCNNTYLQMDDLAIWNGYQLTDEDIDDIFNMNLTAPPVAPVAVESACDSNIGESFRVLCHTFDTDDISGDIADNTGSFGADADARYYEPDTNSTNRSFIINSTGIIEQAVFQDGESSGGSRAEIRAGFDADKSQYDFLHKANTLSNLTSINFWINGDVVGGAEYPIIDTVDVNGGGQDGFFLYTDNGITAFFIWEGGTQISANAFGQEPADDGQWHMMTVLIDKGNNTIAQEYAKICIDGSSNCGAITVQNLFDGGGSTANNTLTIGSRHSTSGGFVENGFNIDDLAIWNGYLLTDEDIDNLLNQTAPTPPAQTFNQTVTDTVTVNENVNATLIAGTGINGTVVVYNSMTQSANSGNGEPSIPLLASLVGANETVTIGETVVFDGEDLTSVRLKISGSQSNMADFTANITAVLWDDDATIGVNETQDFTELARSSLVDMGTEFEANGLLDIGGGTEEADFIWQFNFTGAGTENLSGTYLIGFEVRGIGNEFSPFSVDESEPYPFTFTDGRCWESGSTKSDVVDDIVRFCDATNSAWDHLQIKVFGFKENILEEVIFDNSGEVLFETVISGEKGGNGFIDEGSNAGGSGFYAVGKNGTGDPSNWDVVGNVMPLTDDQITKVVLPVFDCGGNTGVFQLQSVIYDVPTEGVSTTPTIQAVSDTFTIPLRSGAESCTRNFNFDVFTDIEFNFTDAPVLTGDYFIGFRENGTDTAGDEPKFYPAWDINANQSRPLEFCDGCVIPAVEDVEGWVRYGDVVGGANWTSAQGDGITDDSGDSFSVFNMIVFANATITEPSLPYLDTDFDVWQIREHKSSGLGSVDYEIILDPVNNSTRFQDVGDFDPELGEILAFKVFDATEFPSSGTITVDWENDPANNALQIQIFDGAYDRFSSTDFPLNSGRLLKGDGSMYSLFNTNLGSRGTNATAFDVSSGTEAELTLFVRQRDNGISADEGNVFSLDVSGLAFYNFTSPVINFTASTGQADEGNMQLTSVINATAPTIFEFVPFNQLSTQDEVDFFATFGSNWMIGQEINFTDIKPTKVRKSQFNSNTSPTNGSLSVIILSNVTANINGDLQGTIVEAQSDAYDFSTFDISSGGADILQFNFTDAPTLDGTDFAIFLHGDGFNDSFNISWDDSDSFAGRCLIADDIDPFADLETGISHGTTCTDFPFKLFAETTTQSSIVYDLTLEETETAEEVGFVFGNSSNVILGNRVNLTNSQISNVKIGYGIDTPNPNDGDMFCSPPQTGGTIIAKIWETPNVGNLTVPTVVATADTYTLDCDTDSQVNIFFNFTESSPVLTGQYFIGMEFDGTAIGAVNGLGTTFYVNHDGNSPTHPQVPYDDVVLMGYNATNGWIQAPILFQNNNNATALIMGVIQNGTLTSPPPAVLPTDGSDSKLELYYKFNATAPMINEPIARIAQYLINNGTTTSQSGVTEGLGLFGETDGAHVYGETSGNEKSTLVQPEQFDFLNVTGAERGITLNVWARGTGDCGAGDVCTMLDTSQNGGFDDGIMFGISNAGGAGMRFAVDGNFQNIGTGGLSTDNTWHMHTFVMNGTDGDMIAYKDAVNLGNTTVGAGVRNFLPDVNVITIGGQTAGSSNMEQFMDEMSLWSTALTLEQVELLYNNGTGINITGTAPPSFLVEPTETVTVNDLAPVTEQGVVAPLDLTKLEWYFKGEQVAPIINEIETNVGFRESESENSVTLGTGIIGTGYDFSGTADNAFFNTTIANYQRFVDALNDTSGEGVTYNYWLKTGDVNRAQYLIDNHEHGATLDDGCYIRASSLASNAWFQLTCDATAVGDAGDINLSGTLLDDTYHMYTVAIDPINQFTQFYRDGLLLNNFTGTSWNNSTITHGDLTLGSYHDDALDLSAGGQMDEISIWSTELDFEQIALLYNGGNGTEIEPFDLTDLEAYWKFEETSGGIFTEDFVNIPDADSSADFEMSKTETGIIGNAWKSNATGQASHVVIGGTITDWDFLIQDDTSFNFWIIEGTPTGTFDTGVLWSVGNGTTSNGDRIDMQYTPILLDKLRWTGVENPDAVPVLWDESSPSGFLDQTNPNFQMITVTKNVTSDEIKFYSNGTLVATNAVAGGIRIPAESVERLPAIWANSGVVANTVLNDATLDEFSVWSRVLTPQEITNLYNNGDGFELNGTAPPVTQFNVTETDTVPVLDDFSHNTIKPFSDIAVVTEDVNLNITKPFQDTVIVNDAGINTTIGVAPTQPPDPVLNLLFAGFDGQSNNINLEWDEVSNADTYVVERKIGNGAYVVLNPSCCTNEKYNDPTTLPSTEYTYRIAGTNIAGQGAYSNEVTIVTKGTPSASILTAEQVGDVITANWTMPVSSESVTGFQIDRRVNFGAWTTIIADTLNNNTSYVDSNVTKPNVYGYRIQGISVLGIGAVSNVVDVVFGSHVIVHVREQDGSGFKGGGIVKGENSTFSDLIGLDVNSDATFDNLAVGNFNFTFFDDDNYILNKTFNFPAPAGNSTSEFTISALVFDVDCPDNGVGTDVRIKVNYTDAKDIVAFPSTPVCDSTDQVSWSTQWVGQNVTDASTMTADFISTVFKANAEQFLASNTVVPTIYNSGENQIESDVYQVNSTDVTINFNLFMGRAPAGGGGGGSGSTNDPSPPPIPDPEIVFGQRLTGLSLLSRTHAFAQAGDIIEGSITVTWEGENNLDVRSIDTSGSDLDIRFDLTPFPLNQQIEGIGEFAMSTAEIPYTIVLPPQECNEELGISQNCFDPELHTIPLEFEFERDDQVYEASTEVFVDGRPIPIDIVQLQIILLFLVLIASAVFGRFIRNRFKKTTRRTKTAKKKFKKKFDSS